MRNERTWWSFRGGAGKGPAGTGKGAAGAGKGPAGTVWAAVGIASRPVHLLEALDQLARVWVDPKVGNRGIDRHEHRHCSFPVLVLVVDERRSAAA